MGASFKGGGRSYLIFILATFFSQSFPGNASGDELTGIYPNGEDASLQELWDRLCDDAVDGDTINIHIAEGLFQEQLFNACPAAVNVRIHGSGMGKTVLTGPIKTKICGIKNSERVCYESDRQFGPLLVCSRASTSQRPDGTNTCQANFGPLGQPRQFTEICEALAEKVGAFTPWETYCEISDLTVVDGPASTPPYPPGTTRTSTSMIAGTWNTLRVFRVEASGFVDTQLRCTNCRDVEMHHVKVRCPTNLKSTPPLMPYTGIDAPANAVFPQNPSNSNNITGTNIHHAEIDNCERGIFLPRQTEGMITHNHIHDSMIGISLMGGQNLVISHNRIVRSLSQGANTGAGLALQNAHQIEIFHNHFYNNSNAIALLNSAPSFQGFPGPSSEILIDFNSDFRNENFLLDHDFGDNFNEAHTVEPEGSPQGW